MMVGLVKSLVGTLMELVISDLYLLSEVTGHHLEILFLDDHS